MNEMQDKYIRFDWAIKRLLRQKANFDVLEGFLTVFIGERITIVELLESEGNQLSAEDKFNRVDIKALNSKGEIIIIEIQNTRELYYLERILYGVAKAITEHIYLGEAYYKVKKIYSISILYFDIGIGEDYLYHGQNQFIGVHSKDRLLVNTKEREAIVSRPAARDLPRIYPNTRERVQQGGRHSLGGVDGLLEDLAVSNPRPTTGSRFGRGARNCDTTPCPPPSVTPTMST